MYRRRDAVMYEVIRVGTIYSETERQTSTEQNPSTFLFAIPDLYVPGCFLAY